MLAVGLMSGTSRDGIDAALIESDGERVSWHGPWRTVAYDDPFRARLKSVCREGVDEVATGRVEAELTRRHAEAVNGLLAEAGVAARDIGVVGFQGHTVWHRPDARRTRQIGDGQLLADLTGIAVVNDFRSADVAAGGQGAPLAPLYHAALAGELDRPLAVLNLGGVANVTYIGRSADEVLGFDTGPGGALLDDWVARTTGMPFDRDGRLTAGGHVAEAILATLLAHPYFDRPPPKSLDRDDFSLMALGGLGAADGAATLVAFTARAVARAAVHLPAPPRRWIVVGGGRHNPALMAALAHELGVPVLGAESVGWRGDALEAEAFAYLAVRSLRGLPLSLPRTTGVPRPMAGGRLYQPRTPAI